MQNYIENYQSRKIRTVMILTCSFLLWGCSSEKDQTPLDSAKDSQTFAETQTKDTIESPTRDVVGIYNRSCKICHANSTVNAPKTGSSEDWDSRLEKGMETLLRNTINGYKTMPARGMCLDCSEDEFKALIILMSEPSNNP